VVFSLSWSRPHPQMSMQAESPILLIAALALLGLLIFGIVRKLVRVVIIASALGILVIGLFFARSQGLIDW
jgi:uncharacterized membrane protein YqiK